MLSIFRKPLQEYGPIEIILAFYHVAISEFNQALKNEAKRINQTYIFTDMSEENNLKLYELYFSFLFGRIFVRMPPPHLKIIEQNKSSLPPPKLFVPTDLFKSKLCDLLSMTSDEEITQGSVFFKAISIASAYFSGAAKIIEENFKKSLASVLIEVGYSRKFSEDFAKKYIDKIDIIIDNLCIEAEKEWGKIPHSQRQALKTPFGGIRITEVDRIAASFMTVFEGINDEPHYNIFLQPLNSEKHNSDVAK